MHERSVNVIFLWVLMTSWCSSLRRPGKTGYLQEGFNIMLKLKMALSDMAQAV